MFTSLFSKMLVCASAYVDNAEYNFKFIVGKLKT